MYQTHDEQHMIAVCPACHDAIHHGEIPLTDETIYQWKQIGRNPALIREHIYVEPGPQPELWFGSFAIRVRHSSAVIELSPTNSVSMQICDRELLIMSATLTSVDGEEILRIRNNHVRHKRMDEVQFLSIPGQVVVTAPAGSPIVPRWVIDQMRRYFPTFDENNLLTLFRAEVLRPGVARISGIWAEHDRAIIADRGLHFISRAHKAPITLSAREEGKTIFNVSGRLIDKTIFGFGDQDAAFALKHLNPRDGPLSTR